MNFGTCAVCGKRRDEIALIERSRILNEAGPLAEWEIVKQKECVWCIKSEASTNELYPDSDNLVGCPRCGNDILRTHGVCHHCMEEVRAYYG